MNNVAVLDSLSELFMLEEFYEQIEDDNNIDIAGYHIRLTKLLRNESFLDSSIILDSSVRLYRVENDKLYVNGLNLLPYEKLLLKRLCSELTF